MKKILFLIHDLGRGGAEKVLINLVNNLSRAEFNIHVMVLFGGGENEQLLSDDIKFHVVYQRTIPANSKLMKLLTPKQLHKLYIKEFFDIEVSFLEGPCARIISGCTNKGTKLISWIHTKYLSKREVFLSFRNEQESLSCYNKFHHHVFVSKDVKDAFCKYTSIKNNCSVLYNTIDTERILTLSKESSILEWDHLGTILIAVGTLKPVKRFDRLLHISMRLKELGYHFHLFILGNGPLREEFQNYIIENKIENYVTLLGYHNNPYKYIAASDCFICSSQTEGFSTAATESLIVGTPVCTVNVSGMKELLGDNNDYGVITDNSEDALFHGIRELLDNPDLLGFYKGQAQKRGSSFCLDNTIQAVERMLKSM